MKIDHNVAAVLLLGLAAGELRYPPTATSSNRLHTERAPRGSAAEAERMAAAEAKRARRRARLAHSGEVNDR